MSMGPEAKLWKALRPHLEALGCLTTRIENRHGGGLPDVDVSSPVGMFKIELKVTENFSIRISDTQIAYNTLLNHKHGLSFILAHAPSRVERTSFASIFEDQGPSTEDRVGSGLDQQNKVGSGRGKSGRVGSGLGPRTLEGSGRGKSGRGTDKFYLWVGAEAVDVGRHGLKHPALASGDSLADLAGVMLDRCRDHHLRLLGKDPGR